MTSVLSNFAQNPYGVNAAVLSGGNGSNSTTQRAIATIDPRYANTFTIDTTGLTHSSDLQRRVNILIKSVKANMGARLPGKIITLVFKLPPYTGGSTVNISCYFDTSIGNNIPILSTSGFNDPCPTVSLIADGSQFQILSYTGDWGYGND